jgi:hypothetical protein
MLPTIRRRRRRKMSRRSKKRDKARMIISISRKINI